MKELIVKSNTYQDSVNLMMLANQVQQLEGVLDVAMLMATDANKRRLQESGFYAEEFERAGPNDLCIGLEVEEQEALVQAKSKIEDFLSGRVAKLNQASARGTRAKTLAGAIRQHPTAQLVSISIPGEFASREVEKALQAGLHVFLFSDNVPLEDELRLKKMAAERGQLLMGPDCGTAFLVGTPLGFCNQFQAGAIGLVAASGTGAQSISCQLSHLGQGLSHIIGTGGRDLHKRVGGITTMMGLAALAEDPATEVVIYISKPPAKSVQSEIFEYGVNYPKPLVVHFVGDNSIRQKGSLHQASSLNHAAGLAAALASSAAELPGRMSMPEAVYAKQAALAELRRDLAGQAGWVKGLFSGGTLADEAAHLLSQHLSGVQAEKPFDGVEQIQDWQELSGHVILDLGADRFTADRPHPMIDPGLRNEYIEREAQKGATSVILLDVVLGYNAHEDPAGSLAGIIEAARQRADEQGRPLAFLAYVCGTPEDPQGFQGQVEKLEQAGCLVFDSNEAMALAAAWLLEEQERV